MKYLSSQPFSTPAPTDDYRVGHDATFGHAPKKPCAWCNDTGYENESGPCGDPCPRGCAIDLLTEEAQRAGFYDPPLSPTERAWFQSGEGNEDPTVKVRL